MKYFNLFLKEHKGKVALSMLLLTGQVVTTLLIPALIANVIDQGILQGDMDAILRIGMQMLLLALIGTVISILGSWVTSDLGSLLGLKMRTRLFKKVQDLSTEQFDHIGVSSLITRSTSDITNLQQTLGMLLQMVVPAPMIIVVSMVMTYMISPTIALIQLVFMGLLLLFSLFLLKKSNSLSRSIQTRLDHINKVVRESITGVRVIRAFGNEGYEAQRSSLAYESYAGNMIQLNRLFATFNPLVWAIMGILMAVILGVGGMFFFDGIMEIGQITAVIEYAIITLGYVMMGVASFTMVPKALSCLKRLEEVLDMEPSILDHKQPYNNDVKTQCTHDEVVKFHNVSFAYAGAEESIIHNLSFSMLRGQTTAVIGSTGSGKSTLADLLLRIHDIKEGSICINGVDIRDLSQHELRAKIGSVPQKSFLFSGTIADNLRMGKEDASEQELWTALRIAQAEDFVKEQPLGLFSFVSQGGKNFSGGQRQRLSIARALVKNVDVFLFDDSFSALDIKTDSALRKALHNDLSTPSKLIIAQRVSSIFDADQILVLDEGHLVGMGTHTQLVKDCDVYRAIVDSQMKRKEA